MALLEQWRQMAYDNQQDSQYMERFWQKYFLLEKGVYEKLLSNPSDVVTGTVQELADRFGLDIMVMTGFLDGINDSLLTPNPIDTMEADTQVSLDFDREKLYRNMVEAKADWLYTLPQWDAIFDEDKRRELYRVQKDSHTIRREKKIGRNDLCPCGSGRKYKQCCGRKQ